MNILKSVRGAVVVLAAWGVVFPQLTALAAGPKTIGKPIIRTVAANSVLDISLTRGETFTGQTDKGTLQIVINDDAPLGRQAFLRLLTIGVLEDEPIYHGSGFFTLEIVE